MDALTPVAVVTCGTLLVCVAVIAIAVTVAFLRSLANAGRAETTTSIQHVEPEAWKTGSPPEPGPYLIVVDGETMQAELRMCEDEPGTGAWYVCGEAMPLNAYDVDRWFGPFELPRGK